MPLSPDDLQALQAAAPQADATGALQPEQVALIHQRQWLKMLAPRALGGAELALPDVVRLEEALCAADGSTGWVVTLCAGAGWFAGFMPPPFAQALLATPDVCFAGSGAPTGFADRDGNGSRLSGHWAHASGSQLASHYTFNAQLRDAGLPLLDAQGQPRTSAFVVPAAHVRVHPDSWHSLGLKATTSRAFTVDGIRVSAEHAFTLDAAHATAPGALYRFPFLSLALVTLAACLAGMAQRFVTEAQPLTDRRFPALNGPSPRAQAAWQAGNAALQHARADLYTQLDRAWALVQRGDTLSAAAEQALNDAAHTLARTARETADAIYPCCGLRAADPRTAANRAWRDVHTASQHAIWLR